jgi:hypothetical protein
VKLSVKKEVVVEAKTIKIHAKCRDSCSAEILDQDGEKIFDRDGYVPSFMPGEHYGDYLILDIEIDTGRILNWKPPTAQQLEEFIAGEEE